MADGQRILFCFLRSKDTGSISGLARSALQNTRQPESRVDYRILEPDLFFMGPNSHRNCQRQPWLDARLETVRERYVAQLSAESDRCHSPLCRSRAAHYQ